MAVFKLTVVFFLIGAVLSKKLHVKEELGAKNANANSAMNLFIDEDSYTTNERYIRHVKAVTESVLDHLIGEIKHQYYKSNYNSNSPVRRLIRNLNKEMKRNEHNKMVKERQKKKMAHQFKTKSDKKNKKNTSVKPTTKHQSKLVN